MNVPFFFSSLKKLLKEEIRRLLPTSLSHLLYKEYSGHFGLVTADCPSDNKASSAFVSKSMLIVRINRKEVKPLRRCVAAQ